MTGADPSPDPARLLAHAASVRGIARALLTDPSRVDDVVQQTWLRALQERPARVLDPRAWLMGIARNVVRQDRRSDDRRARRERGSAATRRGVGEPSADELVERAEMHGRVVRAVVALDEPYRSTLLLRYFEELSAAQIARRHGVPASTVRNRHKRALLLVRERLEREAGNDRRALGLSLIPLALPKTAAEWAAVSGGAAVNLLWGAQAMKSVLVGAVVLIAGGGITYVYLNRAPDADAAGAPTAAAAAADAARERGTAAAATQHETDTPSRQGRVAIEDAALERTVRGRVVDGAGQPVAGARVFVGAHQSPFAEPSFVLTTSGHRTEGRPAYWREFDPQKLESEGILLGALAATDAAGRFVVELDRTVEPARVWVGSTRSPGVRSPDERPGRWVDVPVDDLELRVVRIPTATIHVSLTDRTAGSRLDAFAGTIHTGGERGASWRSEGAVYERVVEIGESDNAVVAITEPAWAAQSREVRLGAGVSQAVDFYATSGAGVRGQVVAEDGVPLTDAVVYWGELSRMRGRGLFGAFDPERVRDAARTDEAGFFALAGTSDQLTVWHAGHSPVTVPAAHAARIELPSRGAISGRLLDAAGKPLGEQSVELDGARESRTDADGRFTFDAVEAGVHGLRYGEPERRFVGLRVSAGQTLEVPPVERARIDQVEIALFSGGHPFTKPWGGGVFGVDPVFSVHEFGARDGVFKLPRILPGRYVAWGRGRFVVFEVPAGAQRVEADMGDADLTVRAEPGTAVFIVPSEPAEVDAVVGERIHLPVEDGTAYFAPLPRGKYAVGYVGRGERTTVEVAGPGTELDLR